MSTPASSMNWWYIDGSRRLMYSGVRRDVEVHAAVRGPPARLHLGVDGAGHLVTRQQVGRAPVVDVVVVPAVGFLFRVRRLGPEHVGDVVEHEAGAFGVAQHATVTAHALGDEDAAHRQ